MALRIVGVSDTHSYHRQVSVPDGDVFVFAGDATYRGELGVIQDFADWMKALPHKHKLVIWGNHEIGHDRPGRKKDEGIRMIQDAGAIYCEDSGVVIEGYKCHLSPINRWFYDWAWNRRPGKEIMFHWNKIPDDTQILITHGQPYGVLDIVPRGVGTWEHAGDEDLSARIKQLKDLRICLGGHLHTSGGQQVVIDGVIYGNCAICTEEYKPTNNPIVIDI